jgi:EAL domain-containing protein (putative c-di-GMP-specific phosphodiesterase class I)
VDRSFVGRMDEANEYREIVRTIVSLAHTLGMEVVAEGVETRGQRAQLETLGCEFSQGFFFSKPMPADLAYEYLANDRRLDGSPFGPEPTTADALELAESYPM